MKILVSAYACRPNVGSEPGVGWNMVCELAKHHQVLVLTRLDNKSSIDQEMLCYPSNHLKFIYCDPPSFTAMLPSAQIPHYYFWQIGAYFVARKLIKGVGIDLIHHVTYVRYSTPSFLSLLPVLFVWGPVGGGEMAPKAFLKNFSFRGKCYELLRYLTHRLGELDPFTQITARRSILVKATTKETAKRIEKFCSSTVKVSSAIGISNQEFDLLSNLENSQTTCISSPFRFISIARLLHWKGLHLSVEAFAQASLPQDSEYWIIGDGPEKSQLQLTAQKLGVMQRVKFEGSLPREKVLLHLTQCNVLVHPSLHESGGLVCLEAMAAGRPVICLDLGGPSIQVTKETGIKVSAHNPDQTVKELAAAMEELLHAPVLCKQMGAAGKLRVQQYFSWEAKGRELSQEYIELHQEVVSCVF